MLLSQKRSCIAMIKIFEFDVLHQPAMMLGFFYHDEHPETGYRAIELFLILFIVSIHF